MTVPPWVLQSLDFVLLLLGIALLVGFVLVFAVLLEVLQALRAHIDAIALVERPVRAFDRVFDRGLSGKQRPRNAEVFSGGSVRYAEVPLTTEEERNREAAAAAARGEGVEPPSLGA